MTTDSSHNGPIFPNLTETVALSGPDQLWVADTTYIAIVSAFVYLAVILDAWSRRVVGYAIARRIDARLTLAALNAATASRKPPPGCIHHSDRDRQYAAEDDCAELAKHGLKGSMRRRANPYDNAKTKSFIKTLKVEEVYLGQYKTFRGRDRGDTAFHRRRVQCQAAALCPRLSESSQFREGVRPATCPISKDSSVHLNGCTPRR